MIPRLSLLLVSLFQGLALALWVSLAGIGMPKGTLAEIIEKVNAEVNRALADPNMLARLAELGGKPIKGTPQDFGRVIAAETAKWAKVVVASGAKVECGFRSLGHSRGLAGTAHPHPAGVAAPAIYK